MLASSLTLGVTDLSFHRVTAALVTQVLTAMGFSVTRVYSPHQQNFQKLQSGDIDLLASAWLPSSHGVYKSEVEQTQPLIELGEHYQPYALWGVPDYVPAEQVSRVEDLLKPAVRERMSSIIQGINAGAGISRFSMQMIKDYQLGAVGYQFLTGSEADCFSAFEQAVAQQQWLVVPLWKPQFLHYNYRIRELVDSKGLLGTVDRAVLLLREDKRSLFTPAQLDRLDSLRFSNDIIAELDYQVCREGLNEDNVAKRWLAHHKPHLLQ